MNGGKDIHSHWTGEITFERAATRGPVIAYRQVAGQVRWDYDKTLGGCRYEGSGTAEVLRNFDLGWAYNYVISGPKHRKVELAAVPDGAGTYSESCPDSLPRSGMSGFAGVQTNGAGDMGDVTPDGTTVEGRHEIPDGDANAWRLEAQRE